MAARDFRNRAVQLPKPDAVIASLPDHFTAAAVVDFASQNSIPAIVDVRDKWPDVFVDYTPKFFRLLAKLLLSFESQRAYRALSRADSLVAMMHSMLDWGVNKARRNATQNDRVFFLSTMERTDERAEPITALSPEHQQLLEAISGKTILSFVGTFNKTQHPALVLDALDILSKEPNFDPDSIAVVIGGDGQDADAVRRRIGELDFVHYVGWLKPHEMRAILVRSDFGLLPMNFSSPAFNNKAFAYLACGLPILNCASGDLAELIEMEKVGINVAPGDPAAMAKAIADCLHTEQDLGRLKSRVQAVYSRLFDQQHTYNSYVDHIQKIVAAYPSRLG